MRKIAVVVLAVVMLAVPAYAECGSRCRVGQENFDFTIPVGAIVEAIGLVAKLVGVGFALPPGAGLLVPDITVTLNTEFSGDASLSCPPDCCPDGRLMMGVDLLLEGEVAFDSRPPLSSKFTAIIPVVRKLRDNTLNQDTDFAPCNIATEWSYTEQNFQVALSFSVGADIVLFPVSDSRGTGLTGCRVHGGCDDYETRPVIVSWPSEIVVPIGWVDHLGTKHPGEEHFDVIATMLSTIHPQWTTVDAAPYTPLLRYEISPSQQWSQWVSFEITNDRWENGKFVHGGQAKVSVTHTTEIPNGATETVWVTVSDPRDPAQRYDKRPMTIRYILNRPPEAISESTTISREEVVGCLGLVRYKARDPDLPDNHGYQLIFEPLGYEGWYCPNGHMFWGFPPGLAGECSRQECELSFYCTYIRCAWPFSTIPAGTYKFPFRVTEYNFRTNEYGFSDTGSWTLTVVNNPPELTVQPSTITTRSGEEVAATVSAADPDGDAIELQQISGPRGFSTVSGTGSVTGSYTWTVPDPYRGWPWRLVGFKATDPYGGADTGYLLIHVLQPPRVSSGQVTVRSGESATTLIYAEDPDSDSLTLTFDAPDGITVEKIGEQPLRDYEDWGQGGRFYELAVSVARGVGAGRSQAGSQPGTSWRHGLTTLISRLDCGGGGGMVGWRLRRLK